MLLSKSGRQLVHPQFSRIISERTAKNATRKIDAWLKQEALIEATGNDYITTLLSCINPKCVSVADRDMMNLVLFGDANGRMLECG